MGICRECGRVDCHSPHCSEWRADNCKAIAEQSRLTNEQLQQALATERQARERAEGEKDVAEGFHSVAVAERNLAHHQLDKATARAEAAEARLSEITALLTPLGMADYTWSEMEPGPWAAVSKAAALAQGGKPD